MTRMQRLYLVEANPLGPSEGEKNAEQSFQ